MDIDYKRLLFLNQSITEASVKEFQQELIELLKQSKDAPIALTITCGGGVNAAGYGLYDLLLSTYKPNLITIASGRVASMALVLYLAGQQRKIGKNAELFLHEVGLSFDQKTRFTLTALKVSVANLEKDHDNYVRIIHERTGGRLSLKEIKDMMRKETYLTAKQAVKFGFAHEII